VVVFDPERMIELMRCAPLNSLVLVVSEGTFGGRSTSYYDFYRIQDGKIAEHWDTLEPIPPRADWKNANGKF
jgi:predicted SnoaL-like aldol condensation-catalyzing enzyme